MKKTVLISTLMLALGASFTSVSSFARPNDCMGGGPMMSGGNQGAMSERMADRMKQRQQRLHDDLKLNSEQEKAWSKFQESHPFADPAQRPDPAEMAKLSAPERAEKMLENMKKHQDAMSQHLTALKAFYGQLSSEQKKTFDEHFNQRPQRGPRGDGMRGGPAGQAPAAN